MSSTPEINRSVKFSPYGKPINKSLLTPCRTLGLSRKRKTPCNLTKTPINSNVIQSKECGSEAVTPLSNSTSVTPLNNNTPITPLNSNTPVTNTESSKTSGKQVIKRPKRGVIGKDRAVKKCLDQNFQNALQENIPIKEQTSKENTSILLLNEPKKIQNNSVKTKKSLINVKVSLERLSEEDIGSYSKSLEENNISSDEESEEIIKVRKRQAIISSDEEEENFNASDGDEKFQGFSSKNNMGELKNENLSEINCEKEDIVKKNTESNYDERLSDISQNESVELHMEHTKVQVMPSKKILPLNDSKKHNNIEADTVVLSGSSTKSENSKKTSIVSDDDDFVNIKENKKKLTLIRRESSNTNQRSKEDKKSKINDKKTKRTNSNENNSNTFQQTKSLTSIIDNEEDAFTSTPEREKNEKIILVQKVKDLENEVKVKRKKVEDLKQAQIYKTKHNIDELKSLTDIWRGGCVKGLNELLNKLQMHGPINMLTLVNNLKIPSDIVEKCLKMNFIDKKNLEPKNDSEFDASPN